MTYDDDCLVMNATTAKGLNGEVVVVGRGRVNRRQNQMKDETQKRTADKKKWECLCVCVCA